MSKIQTYTGKIFDYANPTPDMICIEDIAHALSMQTRYAGHCRQFYSIAQHSILCARVAGDEGLPDVTIMQCLMHDAPEAYITDLPKPLKELLPNYNCIEESIHRVIAAKFDIPYPFFPVVKEIDRRVLVTEAPIILGELGPAWDKWKHHEAYSYPWIIDRLNSPYLGYFAETEFLYRYHLLGDK